MLFCKMPSICEHFRHSWINWQCKVVNVILPEFFHTQYTMILLVQLCLIFCSSTLNMGFHVPPLPSSNLPFSFPLLISTLLCSNFRGGGIQSGKFFDGNVFFKSFYCILVDN